MKPWYLFFQVIRINANYLRPVYLNVTDSYNMIFIHFLLLIRKLGTWCNTIELICRWSRYLGTGTTTCNKIIYPCLHSNVSFMFVT